MKYWHRPQELQSARIAEELSPAARAASRHQDPPQAVDEILQEQWDYLLNHGVDPGHGLCPDCERLRRVKNILLAPFC